MHHAAQVSGVGAEHGIPWGGEDGHIARIDKAERQHGQCGFGADTVNDIRGRVQTGHSKKLFHVIRCGFLEGRDAIVGVSAVVRIVHRPAQSLADGLGGHPVRFAHTEVQ